MATRVWLRAEKEDGASEAFVCGTVDVTDAGGTVDLTDEEAEVVVQLQSGGSRRVAATDCMPANPAGMTAPDNAQLIHLSEATILANLQARFAEAKIYTYVGSIIIAINPFERLPLYEIGRAHV